MKNAATRTIARTALKGAAPLVAAGDALTIITAGLTYLTAREEEATKRAYLTARRDVLVTAITAEHRFLQAYVAQRFGERRAVLDAFFSVLQEAVSARDLEVIDRALTGILGVLKDHPLQDLETFRRWWEDASAILEL